MQRWISLAVTVLLLLGCAGTVELPERTAAPSRGEQAARPLDPVAEQAFQAALSDLKAPRLEQAIDQFRKLTLSHPGYRGPWINLGIALREAGRTDESLALFRDMVSAHADWAVAHHELAILQRQQGQFEAARRSYEAAIQINPDFALAYRNLGLLCDLYLHDINCALSKYEKYQTLLGSEDKEVALWVADAKRRLTKDD